jgi:hypothetical protein
MKPGNPHGIDGRNLVLGLSSWLLLEPSVDAQGAFFDTVEKLSRPYEFRAQLML